MRREDGDVCFTIIHGMGGMFLAYDKAELLLKLQKWAAQKCVVVKNNVAICDKEAWLVTIQPAMMTEDNCPAVCPLAMAFDIMVSGFSYVMWSKSDFDLVDHVLGKNIPLDE